MHFARVGRYGLQQDRKQDEHSDSQARCDRNRMQCYISGSHERSQSSSSLASAAARSAWSDVCRWETDGRIPVAGAQGRRGAAKDPGPAQADRYGERQAGAQRDAEARRRAEDRGAGVAVAAAGRAPRRRLRPADETVASRQIRTAMTETVTRVKGGLDQLCINTIRTLAMDAVQQADSGHPGTPMALAPLAYVLWQRHLRYNPANPEWLDRDRFILLAGHACMLLYSVLYLTGYDLTLDDIKQFRQWGSRTPGHSEHGVTPGVEATTGPLGQGVGNSVGMAIAEAQLAALFNRPGHSIIDHYTYFLASDGDLMEGISHEAGSLGGHLKLGKLIGFYDDNHITIDGSTDLAFSDDTAKRIESYGWHVLHIADVNDLDEIEGAIAEAQSDAERPTMVITRTHIGYEIGRA